MKAWFMILLPIMIVCLSGCSVIQNQVDRFKENVDPDIMEGIDSWIEDQGLNAEETKIRAEVLARAESWIVMGVKYNQKAYYDGYRTDCSGFVSMAWQLKSASGTKVSPTTVSMDTYAADISFDELLPGDILNNKRSLNSGHVVIFVSWLDDEQTRFIAFEENGGGNNMKAVQTELTLEPMSSGGYTIKEYHDAAPGPYYPQTFYK